MFLSGRTYFPEISHHTGSGAHTLTKSLAKSDRIAFPFPMA
jgi:hypothetical protein